MGAGADAAAARCGNHAPMHYQALSARTVGEAMHPGVLDCAPETPLREVARLMARFRVHAIVVVGDSGRARGLVSAFDVLTAIDGGDVDAQTAADLAEAPLVTVRREEPLRRALHLMRAAGTSHAVVVAREGGVPLGVVSSLDFVRALAHEPQPVG
jgi:CBS domain-containing protein